MTPFQLNISSLSASGFRGLRRFDVRFPNAKPLYIVGGNNAGKSTILEAIALVLGGGRFHQFEPEQFGFFHDNAGIAVQIFTVRLSFGADDPRQLPAVQGVGDPIRVHAIEVRGSTDKNGRFSHRRVLLDGNGDHILLSDRTPLKGSTKAEYEGMGLGYRRQYARLDQIRDHLPEVWLRIPWCALSDEDRDSATDVLNPNTLKIQQRVDGMRGAQDLTAIWPAKLEVCLGCPGAQKATPEWQVTSIDPKPLADLQRDHQDLIAVSGAIRTWILA